MKINPDKYYTPKEDEFHSGFRYGAHSFTGDTFNWVKKEYEFGYDLGFSDLRVKYLDRKDIEELGWTETCYMGKGYMRTYRLKTKPDVRLLFDDTCKNLEYINMSIVLMHDHLFYGKVKNYNELKKIMEI